MSDSVDKLSEASGLHRTDLIELWASVKANAAKLEGCSRHDFVSIEPERRIGGKYRCTRCGGEADSIAVRWYREGLQHAEAARD